MAASSSALAAVVPSALVAGPMTPPEALRACANTPHILWPTAELNMFGERAAAVIQMEHLDTSHFGGFYAFIDGFKSSFRIFDSTDALDMQKAAEVWPLTSVPSHGLT